MAYTLRSGLFVNNPGLLLPSGPLQLDPTNQLTQGLVGCYPLANGNTFDYVSNSYPLTTNNGVGGTLSAVGPAMRFTASSSTYLSGAGALYDFAGANPVFTLAGWFYFATLNSSTRTPVPIYKGSFQQGGYYYQVNGSGGISYVANTSGADVVTSTNSGAVGTGAWYHIVVVNHPSVANIYVNGVDKTTSQPTLGGISDSASFNFNVGTYQNQTGNALQLDGGAAGVMIWNRDLSASEVAQLYAKPWSVFKPTGWLAPSAVVSSSPIPYVPSLPLLLNWAILPTIETAGLGTVTVTGLAPSMTVNTLLTSGLGAVTATGFAAAVGSGVVAGIGAMTVTGFVPGLVADMSLSPGAGAIVLGGDMPNLYRSQPEMRAQLSGSTVVSSVQLTVGGGQTKQKLTGQVP